MCHFHWRVWISSPSWLRRARRRLLPTTCCLSSVITELQGVSYFCVILRNIAAWSFEVLINGLVFVNFWRFPDEKKYIILSDLFEWNKRFFPLLNRWSLHSVLSECDQWTVVRVWWSVCNRSARDSSAECWSVCPFLQVLFRAILLIL